MGVVSNKINIMELMKSGGGGDPTIPGRVSVLETETAGLIEANAKIMTSVASLDLETARLAEANARIMTSVAALDLESVALAEGLQRVMTSVSSGRVPMQTGNDIRFGVDGNGDYGYYKAGADTVTPFLTGGGSINTREGSINSASPSTSQLNFTNITNKPLFFTVFPNANFSYTATTNPCAVTITGVYRPNTDDYMIWYGFGITHSSSSANYSANNYNNLTAVYDSANSKMTITSSDTTKIIFPNVVTKWKMWYVY